MPTFMNLLLVGLLIGSSGMGGYLLARAHFTATIANRVMAYQARLARATREGKQAQTDVERLTAEVAGLQGDLDLAKERVARFELALFETGTVDTLDRPEVEASETPAQDLQRQAAAYVQHVTGFDDFDRSGDQDDESIVLPSVQLHEAHQLSRAIA